MDADFLTFLVLLLVGRVRRVSDEPNIASGAVSRFEKETPFLAEVADEEDES